MKFKLSYDNGINSFNYELSGDQTPEENIVEVFRMAIDTLFPQALFIIPEEAEVSFTETDEREQTRTKLYDEVDQIIDEMYGYYGDE